MITQAKVVTYDNRDDYVDGVNEMMEDGWFPINTFVQHSHINWGRTILKIVFTGGLGLLFGGPSRSPTLLHVTWGRSNDALVYSRSVPCEEWEDR